MKRFFSIVLVLTLLVGAVRADEGMWLPSLIGSQKIADMQSKGFQLTAQDLYDINNASLKDAIVRFGGGCTGELVSGDGLMLTNHHCGYDWIQKHSSVQNDYLTHGFWAMNRQQELPNPGLKVTFLVRMDDVTKQALKGIKSSMTEEQRAEKIEANSKAIVEKAIAGTHYRASVEPFFYGNLYYIFIYEDYEDVRLVAAPPSSIGKFGGDTDNWMWPRHTGDFSVFRIYAGPDNKPAPYSPDNVPFRPKRFLTVSTQGADEGDFTFIYGFPGRTSEYVTSDAIKFLVEKSNPHKVNLRTIRLGIMDQFQEKDPAVRIQYAAKHASVANSWKRWQGEMKGLIRNDVVREKITKEEQFAVWAANKKEFRDVLPQMASLYAELDEYAFARDYYTEAFAVIELTKFAATYAALKEQDLTDEKIRALETGATAFYKDYYLPIDKLTAAALLKEYDENVPERFKPAILNVYKTQYGSLEKAVDWLFQNSLFTTPEKLFTLKNASSEASALTAISDDPAVKLYRAFHDLYRTEILPKYIDLNQEITTLYRTYMKGMMQREKDRIFYPDANSTLRIAYGKVNGYAPMDAVYYEPYTSIEGIMEKDDPNIYDYNIPQKLRDIYAAKDYGRWEVNGSVPVCFLAVNHSTGGNSGSPILNARGELLGLNFDRTWESTMSDIYYDPEICRNISVDVRYVLFVMDKIGGVSYLFDEMRFAE